MNKVLFLAVISVVICVSAPAWATTWYVDGSVSESGDGTSRETAFQRIQQGIDAAADGDTVIVEEGVYHENIQFNGKNITLRSSDPLDWAVVENTVMDGNEAGSVVTFDGTENETCVLCGFTIRNGSAYVGGGICGGPWNCRTLAGIRNNRITRNFADDEGGGLWNCNGILASNLISENRAYVGAGLYGCNGTIQNNSIRDNSAERYGGGLYDCDGTIRDNEISSNSTGYGGGGGAGLYHCDGTIRNNAITHNSVENGSGGGLGGCQGLIASNRICHNVANSGGGGLNFCPGIVENNIIAANVAKGIGGGISGNAIDCRNNLICANKAQQGGGLAHCSRDVYNNTVVDNSAHEGGGLWDCKGTIRNCVVWGNTADVAIGEQLWDSSMPSYSCIEGGAAGEGNSRDGPQFLDPDGPDDDPETYGDNDYRLGPNSPCIDAGKGDKTHWILYPPGFDLDGNLRIALGRDSLTVDMGAYEFNSRPFTVTQIVLGPSSLEVTWNSQPNDTYTVWSSLDVRATAWTRQTTVPSQGSTSFWTDSTATGRMKFYRVEIMKFYQAEIRCP